jgi:hypothetical protein
VPDSYPKNGGQKVNAVNSSDQGSETITIPTLLSDSPADLDAFGSHERVVKALARIIEHEQEGQAIALSGRWGSGKSTVINLLRSYFRRKAEPNQSDIRVFVFDAWAHQGDPLRRAFLAELISFLGKDDVKTEWINKDEWSLKLEKITTPKDEATKSSAAVIGVIGSVITILVLLMPLGVALLAKGSASESILPHLSNMWLGIVLLSLPPGLAILVLIWKPVKWLLKKFVPKTSWLHREIWGDRPELGRLNPIAYLISKPLQTETAITVRTPDPTSVEFRNFFFDLMDTALRPNNVRSKLVIAIDNLDRVNSKGAMDIWSTMRTFFDPHGEKAASWKNRFWLIVAFDPTGMRNLFGRGQSEPDEPTERASQQQIGGDDLVDVFVDKTFQAKFRISPPVLTSWKLFFEAQLAEAFGGCSIGVSELHQLYVLYSVKVTFRGRPPTPRDIKLFINRVIALYVKWGSTIPLVILGVYALYEKEIASDQNHVMGDNLIPAAVRRLLDGNDWAKYHTEDARYSWREYLCAIHYNLEPDKAVHMLYGGSVSEGLRKAQISHILSLAEQTSGIEPLIEHVVVTNAEIWASTDPSALTNAAWVLANIWPVEPTIWDEIWKTLGNWVKTVEKWDKINESIGDGLGQILLYHSQEKYDELAKILLKSLVQSFPVPVKPGSDVVEQLPNENNEWAKATVPVLAVLADREAGSLIEECFTVPGDVNSYFKVIFALCNTSLPDDIVGYYTSIGHKEEFIPGLRELMTAGYQKGQFLDSLNDPISLVRRIPGTWSLSEVCETLVGEWIYLSEGDGVLGCLEGIVSCAIHGVAHEAHQFVNNFAAEATKHKLFQKMVEDNHSRAVSLAMFVRLHALRQSFTQADRSTYAAVMADFKPIYRSERRISEITEAFAHLLLKFRNLPDILHKLTNLRSEVFILDIVEAVARRVKDYRYYLPQLVISNYNRFAQEHRGIDIVAPIIRNMLVQTDFLELLSQVPYSEKTAGLFSYTLRTSQNLKLSDRQKHLRAQVEEIFSRGSRKDS